MPERFNRRRTERRLIVGRHRYGLVPSAIATAMDLETSLIEKEFFRVATPETPAGRMEFQTLLMETQEHRGRIAARLAEERERQ